MVTCRNRAVISSLVLGGVFGVLACGAIVPVDATTGGGQPGTASGSPSSPTMAQTKYPGHGFVVHEWGTNTIVVGSDGSMQRGLHHEEEDLPSFVYDRLKEGELGLAVDVKMETPVTYFYSDTARDVKVSVAFPNGVLTQWYPSVASFAPPVIRAPSRGIVDPVMDPNFAFSSDTCRSEYGDGKAISGGLLDWGTVRVLGRDAAIDPPQAPIDQFTWSHARAVASNPLVVNGTSKEDEFEQFLFYRGLGNLTLPVAVRASGGGVALSNKSTSHVGSVFVLRVDATSGAFVVHPEGISPSTDLTEPFADKAAQPIDTYADSLATAMTAELDKTGLYHDEALAMVNTWKRQWFKTPGLRVLYLAPQPWTDAQIPLTIDPKPDQTTRVMVIRVEAITPDQETADTKVAAALDDDYATGRAYFVGLGRFGEPRLRRAMQILQGGPKGAWQLLSEIEGANTSVGAGE
jgi:hypothetical protein